MNGIAKIASTLTARRLLEHAPTTVLPTAHIAEKVSTLLLASHCCPRCILRFLGVRDRKVHASFLGLTKEWVRSEIVSKSEEVEGAVDVVESAGNEEEESNVTTVQPVKKLKAESPDGTIVEGNAIFEEFAEVSPIMSSDSRTHLCPPSSYCSDTTGNGLKIRPQRIFSQQHIR